jgi:hypothetical protein
MRELSFAEFYRALARYGFEVSGNRIFDVSGRCPGGSWPVVLNLTLQIDRHRTIRKAVKERADEMARLAQEQAEPGGRNRRRPVTQSSLHQKNSEADAD